MENYSVISREQLLGHTVWFIDNMVDRKLKHGRVSEVESTLQSYDCTDGTTHYYYVNKYDVQCTVTDEVHKNVYKIFLTECEGLEYIAGTLSVAIAVQEDERKQCLQRVEWLEDEISSAIAKLEEIKDRLNEI